MKKKATPDTLIIAPRISRGVTFCLYTITAGAMIRTGTIAMMVDAIPVWVWATARSEKETPRKGPKKDPRAILCIAFR